MDKTHFLIYRIKIMEQQRDSDISTNFTNTILKSLCILNSKSSVILIQWKQSDTFV